jgi:hypothetical protein
MAPLKYGPAPAETAEAFVVTMRQYASSLKGVLIPRTRRKELESPLDSEELKELQRCSGEIGWLGRQGRIDISHLAGELQRASGSPCVADLVKCNLAVAEAKRGKDVALRYPRTLSVSSLCVGAAVIGMANSSSVIGLGVGNHTGGGIPVALLVSAFVLLINEGAMVNGGWYKGLTNGWVVSKK